MRTRSRATCSPRCSSPPASSGPTGSSTSSPHPSPGGASAGTEAKPGAPAGEAALSPRILSERREALGDLRPVDHVPPRIDVVGAPVLVLEVVGVLPHVHPEQGGGALRDRVVLVGATHHRQARSIMDQP